jgi:drug/metabolite transporter (DMT)-like permease
MPASALSLALAAAILHAAWNAFLAGSRNVRAATVVVLGLSIVVFAPIAAATWRVESAAIPWIVASSALELVYFALLATAYGRSALSLVYPVARGAAPVLVLVGAVLTGAALDAWQAVGVVAVGFGILLVRGTGRATDPRSVALALLIGVTIAGYTLVDKQGIEYAAPIPYLELVLAPVALVGVGAFVVRGRAHALRVELRWTSVAAAVSSFAAYTLVLAALSLAPAAAVAAVRETSILFAVALGAAALREPVGRIRAAGAATVVAGVALVALG